MTRKLFLSIQEIVLYNLKLLKFVDSDSGRLLTALSFNDTSYLFVPGSISILKV